MLGWGEAIGVVSKLAGRVVDRVLPETMSEKERAELTIRAEQVAQELALEEEKLFRGFVVDYEGRAADLPEAVQVLRASVRPLLSYLLVITTAWLVWNGRPIPVELHQLDLLCLAFWFGERAVRNYIRTKQGQDGGVL
jgi:hypothetical protein